MQAMIDRIGGEAKVRELVNRFYDLVETDPQGRGIMDLHLQGHGLSHVRPAQFDFLCGFFGGPRYYAEHHGHMNLREIHAHMPITQRDAEDWLALMDRAMADVGIADPMRTDIARTFRRAALMLANAI